MLRGILILPEKKYKLFHKAKMHIVFDPETKISSPKSHNDDDN